MADGNWPKFVTLFVTGSIRYGTRSGQTPTVLMMAHPSAAFAPVSLNGCKPILGLAGACTGGQLHAIKWMIRCGARNYDHGLSNATMENHIDIVLYMLELGATDHCRISRAFSIAFHNNHFALAHILLERGAKQCTHTNLSRTLGRSHHRNDNRGHTRGIQ